MSIRIAIFRSASRAAHCASLAALLLLASCASKGPELVIPPPVLTPWTDERPAVVDHGRVAWTDAGRERTIEIEWAVPHGRPPVALVLFLPALGDNAEDASLLVNAIAAAGYAVVGIGHPGNDASVWQGDLARRAEFALIARRAFAPAPAAQRAADVRYVLDRLERQPPQWLGGINISRSALIGYDLGAHTAQLMAGEHLARDAAPAGDPHIAAVVLLDPYVGFDGPPMQDRYRDIKVPLLTVFGANDSDAYGLGITATQRRSLAALAINAPVYELRLGGAAVRTLVVPQTEKAADAARAKGGPSGDASGRRRGGRGGQSQGEGAGADSMEQGRPEEGEPSGPNARAARFTAFNSMVLGVHAFLDAELLGNRDARQWLNDRRSAPFAQWTRYEAGRAVPAVLPR